jgi:hypothetical protein
LTGFSEEQNLCSYLHKWGLSGFRYNLGENSLSNQTDSCEEDLISFTSGGLGMAAWH